MSTPAVRRAESAPALWLCQHQTRHFRGRSCLPLFLAAVLALAAVRVQGENAAPDGAADAQQAQLSEIVVTAERRSENLERTPLAITALSGSELDALGVSQATALSGRVPDLNIANAGLGAQISIRGVVSTNDTEVGDPAVAFNVDGVYLARSREALGALYDIKRIEVLMGPQGTLYGRNATAGAVNVITNHPDLSQFSDRISIEYGNHDELRTFGMANLPVTASFGVRAAFQTDRHSGYSSNLPAQPYNDLDSTAGRAEALWNPSSDITALLTVDYYHNGGSGSGGGSHVGWAPIGAYAADTGAKPYDYEISRDGVNDETGDGATLTVNWKLPLASLTYVGNYHGDDWYNLSGDTITGPNRRPCQTVSATNCRSSVVASLDHQTSHELRLSHDSDRLAWVLGIYYFREHNNVFASLSPIGGVGEIASIEPNTVEVSKSVFGQATWRLWRRLRLIGGARYNDDHKAREGGAVEGLGSLIGETCVRCSVLIPEFASLSWYKFTWKGGLDFDANRHTMLYATVGTGYKAGGYGDGVPPNNDPYKPESMLAYEAGTKSVLFDHRLQLNLDAFHDLYSDYQASGQALVAGQPSLITVNAGKATIDGVELTSAALLTPRDRLSFAASYLHAYFTQFYLPLGDAFNTGPISYRGNTLPNAPRVTVHLGYQHAFVFSGGAALVPRIDTGWVDRQNLDYHNYAITEQGSYTRTDLSLTYQAEGTWQAMLYARNVENKAIMATAVPDPGALTPALGQVSGFARYMAPRTYGIQLSASFR